MKFISQCLNFSFILVIGILSTTAVDGEYEESQTSTNEDKSMESPPILKGDSKSQSTNIGNEASDADPFAEFIDPNEIDANRISKKSSPIGISNVTIAPELPVNFTKVNCLTNKTYGPVEKVNHTRFMELLIFEAGTPNRTRSTKEDKALPGVCVFVMFYARWCIFSSQAAPHFNAIPRFYPHLKVVAIDAMKYQNFNTQYGIVGVPTLMLVHNSKPIAKFNETVYTLETFSKFLSHLTNLQPNESLYVTSADFKGPVSSIPSNETDYCLVISWIFIVACLLYFTTKSQWWKQFIELVQNTWRESNAQHEHAD